MSQKLAKLQKINVCKHKRQKIEIAFFATVY